jgi:hypothetical protein
MYEVRKYDWRSRDSDSQCVFDARETQAGLLLNGIFQRRSPGIPVRKNLTECKKPRNRPESDGADDPA